MKKILFVISLSLISLLTYSQGKTPPEWPGASSIGSADLFLLWQSGALKNLPYSYLGDVISDTADVLRAELPPLYRGDIHDTADVLRTEIATASTIDTAWARQDESVILKFITDSVGIGTIAPSEKLEVTGNVKALRGIFDNGYNNLLLGVNSGESLTSSGQNNVFAGYQVAKDATAPDFSIGIGTQALYTLTTGSSNVGVGYRAGYALTDGQSNIFLGNLTGYSVVTGDYNIMIGDQAGYLSSTSSSDNVFIGRNAGYNADVNNAVFIGSGAGYNCAEAGMVAIGKSALSFATSSTGSTAIGNLAGLLITTSDYHTIMGYQAGDAITTGSDGSTLFGCQAGTEMTTSDGTSLFGYHAGQAVTTSDYHTVVGYEALDALQTSNGSTVMGYQSGTAATGAAGLTAMGYLTGKILTTGDENTFIGYLAGDSIVTGSENTFIGYHTGSATAGVNGSVALGYNAGSLNTSSNRLHIANSNTGTPLLWGDFTNARLVINGNAASNPNDRNFYVNGDAGGDGAWNNDSDSTLKFNVREIRNPLKKVMQLRGVTFLWKDSLRGVERNMGFLAQEAVPYIPEVVEGVEGSMSMQYAPVVALLTEAIQTQQHLIIGLFFFILMLTVAIVYLFIKVKKMKYVKYR